MSQSKFQTVLQLVFPPRCISCGTQVESDFGLCGPCWRDTPFIGGLVCDCCGVPLPGEVIEQGVHCDSCMQTPRPWAQGRAALLYQGNGRKMVLALKHGDRNDMARPAAIWMARAARPLLRPNMIVVPVPLHWQRMVSRRYNQSALLAQALARELELAYCPDLLLRPRTTGSLEGLNQQERQTRMRDAITLNPRRKHRIAAGRPVLLVDDVMTTGATMAAASLALTQAGAREVCAVTLARVAKDA